MNKLPAPVVLLVDAHDDARQMYREFLNGHAMTTVEAHHTDDALTLSTRATIVVTELRVPGTFDGFELIRRIRDGSTGPAPRPLVIVLTASTLAEDRSRSLEAGCDLFLEKPCLPDALLTEIRNAIAKR